MALGSTGLVPAISLGGWTTEKQIILPHESSCVATWEQMNRPVCPLLDAASWCPEISAVTKGLLCWYTIVGKHLEHSFEYGHCHGMSRVYFKIHAVCLNRIAGCYVKDEHRFPLYPRYLLQLKMLYEIIHIPYWMVPITRWMNTGY